MRAFEWLIALVVFIAVVSVSFIPAGSSWPLLLLLLLLIPLLCAHAWFEGMHWQMIPIYLAGLLLIPIFLHMWMNASPPRSMLIVHVFTSAALLLTGLAASYAMPMFKLMTPTGSYPVGTRTLYLTDTGREEMHPGAPPGKREVVVQLWYPAATHRGPQARYRLRGETKLRSSYQRVLRTQSIQDAAVAAGAFPLLIFNHAWGGFRNRSTFLAQELASHGFVVATISHPYNANLTVLRDGRVAVPVDQVNIGFYAKNLVTIEDRLRIADAELTIQVDDCIFVLDELAVRNNTAGDAFHGHLRMDAVGTYGHSYGGAACFEFAREDARVRSVLALDGVLHGRALREGLEKPFMFIDSSWLATPQGNEEDADPARRSTAQLWGLMHRAKKKCLAENGGWELVIAGTNHENFTDVTYMSPLRRLSNGGPLPQPRASEIISAYAVAFFRQTLLGERMALLSPGGGGFAEATFRVWEPEAPTSEAV